MKKDYLLFTPGPTLTSDKSKEILGLEVFHHRSSFAKEKFASLKMNLNNLVNNPSDYVAILTSSGTGAMESTVVNFVSTNDKIIVLDTGFFAKRYINICRVYNNHVEVTTEFNEFKEKVSSGDYDVAILTHHETTTGQINDIETIGKSKHKNTLLMVDAISSMGVHEVNMKDWNLDVVSSSSQKGFDVAPGLAFVIFNENANTRRAKCDLPKYYFDFTSILKSGDTNQPFTTMPTNLLWALEDSIKKVIENGIESNYDKFSKRKDVAFKALSENGLELHTDKNITLGNVVLPIKVDFDPDYVVSSLWEKYKVQLINGYGAPCVRLGLIGDFSHDDLRYAISCLAKILEELKNEN